jgi:hypothetical protein
MATNYTGLKTEIQGFIERSDLSTVVDTFIDLCESEMQRSVKILEFETTGTVTITDGAGSLPTGFVGARSVSWETSPERLLRYVPPDELLKLNAGDPSTVNYYTVTGSEIKVADDQSGTLNVTYMARFTPLSDSAPTNAILTNHPAAYLYGSLVHAAVYCKDFEGAIAYQALFQKQIDEINADNKDRKYPGQLVQRPA